MLVSWNWLKDYVPLDMSPQQLVDRLMMSGLNHESTTSVGSDLAIDKASAAKLLGKLEVSAYKAR